MAYWRNLALHAPTLTGRSMVVESCFQLNQEAFNLRGGRLQRKHRFELCTNWNVVRLVMILATAWECAVNCIESLVQRRLETNVRRFLSVCTDPDIVGTIRALHMTGLNMQYTSLRRKTCLRTRNACWYTQHMINTIGLPQHTSMDYHLLNDLNVRLNKFQKKNLSLWGVVTKGT